MERRQGPDSLLYLEKESKILTKLAGRKQASSHQFFVAYKPVTALGSRTEFNGPLEAIMKSISLLSLPNVVSGTSFT